jgi:hypothetical protein
MSVDARIRKGLTMIEEKLPQVDTLERYDALGTRVRKHQQRRTTVKVIAAAAAVALGAVVIDAQLGQERAAPPAGPSVEWVPPSEWVLVTSSLVGTDYAPPVGDEWSKPLGDSGVKTYPYWKSVDPATRRFLINAETARETALEVMTPGRAEPLLRLVCDNRGSIGCAHAAAPGPGPEELTMWTGDFHLVVAGHDGQIRRDLGPAGQGLLINGLAWASDGSTLAVAYSEHSSDQGSLTVALRHPDSAADTTLYEYSEAAPPWFDAEEHRFGSGPGEFNSWWAPRLADLQWAPDSTRLALAITSTPEDGDDEARHLQWKLFVSDPVSGEVEQIADLGRCTEPLDENGHFARLCEQKEPSLSWTPDGKRITVLADSTLTTYDLTGKELSSEHSDLIGPIVWMTRK